VLTFKKGYRDHIENEFMKEPIMKKHQGLFVAMY
jgi:hypothetical protein